MQGAERLVSDLRRYGGAALWPLRRVADRRSGPRAIIDEPDELLVELATNLADASEGLSRQQRLELEAMAWTLRRPSYFLDADTFSQRLGHWEVLADHRSGIERVRQSVGRIEIQGSDRLRMVGTGFVVGDHLVLH